MSLGLQYKNQEHIFDEKTVNGVPFLSYPMLEETGIVHHGFSTKLGGVSTSAQQEAMIRKMLRKTREGLQEPSE